MKIDNNLSEVFDTEPMKIEAELVPAAPAKDITNNTKIEDDYEVIDKDEAPRQENDKLIP